MDYVEITAENVASLNVACQWFTLCQNAATHMEPHTIYGQVPCCDRCAKIGA
jgi:hypothetical protein